MIRWIVGGSLVGLVLAWPLRPQAQDVSTGAALFGERCAVCHGGDARGAIGPSLVTLWASGATDERVLRTIRQGVPGSAMPPSMAPDDELRAIVAFLKTLAAPAPGAAAGGGRGASPPAPGVTLVLRDGRQITGTRRGEDAFSIQIEDTQGRLQGFAKSAVQEIVREAGPAPRAREAHPAVTARDILDGLADPSRWLTFSGDYSGRRHSPIAQITPANVHRLTAQWTFQSGTMTRGRGFEVDGARARRRVVRDRLEQLRLGARCAHRPAVLAIPARAAARSHLRRASARQSRLRDPRRSAVHGHARRPPARVRPPERRHRVGHGSRRLQDRLLGDDGPARRFDDKIIVGISGGEYPTRGFLDAYNPETGARIWRFYTVPAPGEPGSETWPSSSEVLARGGGGTWMTGSYDPELNLLYWGTGNPNPDYWGHGRLGDNLYTNSLVAIDADTGRLKWHYQFTPHDTHDWDSNHVPVLGDGHDRRRRSQGRHGREPQRVLLRRSIARPARCSSRKPFTDTTWAREIGRDGRPIVLNDGSKGCLPDQWGGTNFNPPSFDPSLQLFLVTARETCATYATQEPKFVPGQASMGGAVRVDRERPNYAALRAIDAATGERRWEFRYASPAMSGVLSTASGLVFTGDNEGNFMAFDTRTGRNLWRYQTGNGDLGRRADDLRARRPPARARSRRDDARRVRAASTVGRAFQARRHPTTPRIR